MATHGLTVGQKLWFVPRDKRDCKRAREVEILSIGRKWAELSNKCRINVDTLHADGKQYASPGRCWLSENDWKDEAMTGEAYLRLAGRLGYRPREGVMLEDIQQAATLLGITLE